MTVAALDNYIILERVVEDEIERLSPAKGYGSTMDDKARQISDALDRIFLMKLVQNPGVGDAYSRFTCIRINPEEASNIDLKTIRAMLDAHISAWEFRGLPSRDPGTGESEDADGFYPQISLREALNISSSNFFNYISDGTLGPIIGKDESLVNVENALKQNCGYIIL